MKKTYNTKELLDQAIDNLNDNTITIDLSGFSDSNQMSLDLPNMDSIANINLNNVYDSGYDFNIDNDTIWSMPTQQSLHVQGDAEFEGDIKIKGESLNDMISAINERLAILKPNPDLETRWEQLKELGKQYRELEKELLDKEKMWDKLKQ